MSSQPDTRDDIGLFGPQSVTWYIHVDPVMWVAAFTALAMQSLHPRTMWGTYQNSELFLRPEALRRLFRTADYVSTRTFGTTSEARRAGQRVRGIHRSLTGLDEHTGQRFPIDDEENLLWVHCAEIYSYLRVAWLSGLPLTSEQADTYIDEQRRSAGLVGLDPQRVPKSQAELDEYFARMEPALELTTTAKRGIRMWLNTPAPARLIALRVVYPYLGGLGVALLPGWARRFYGVPAHGPAGRAIEATAAGLARLTRQVMLRMPARYTGTREQMRRVQAARRIMTVR